MRVLKPTHRSFSLTWRVALFTAIGLAAAVTAATIASAAPRSDRTSARAYADDSATPLQNNPTEAYALVDTWTSRRPNNGVPEFLRPAGLDVASDGSIYVADARAKLVHHLDSRGRGLASWTPGSSVVAPLDVAVTNDRVYVIGGPNDDGEIRDRAGGLIGTFLLDRPTGIAAAPDGRIFVARLVDVAGGRTVAGLDVRDADGNPLATWTGEPLIRIRDPHGVDVATDGTVYLAAEGAIYAFKDGAVVGLLRLRPEIEGRAITDVAVDGTRVYAALEDTLAGWVGGVRTTPPDVIIDGAQNVAVGPGGGLVLSVYNSNGLSGLSYLSDRNDLRSSIAFWGRAEDALGELQGPSRVSVAGADQLFISDDQVRVQQWDALGEPVAQWTGQLATDLASDGPLACATDGAKINCLGPGGILNWSAAPPATSWLSAIDGNASSLFAVDLAQQVLWVFDRSGALAGSQPLEPGTRFVAISDVAADADAVFLADRSNNTVVQRDLAGQVVGSFPVPRGPVRISAADGAVFVITLDGYVWKHTRDGTLLSVFKPPTDPADVAAGPSGRVYVASASGDQVFVYEPDAGAPPPILPPPPPADTCTVVPDKRASPAVVVQGDPATIELEVTGACPFGVADLDIMLVVDRSGSMLEPRMTAAKSASVAFLGELDPSRTQAGLIAFSTDADVSQPLTTDIRAVVSAVAQLTIAGQTFFQEALDLATTQLTGPAHRPGAERVVIMLTDGQPTDRVRGQQAADRLKAEGITLYMIGLGQDLDADLMRAMATSPDLYFAAPSSAELASIYTGIARRIGATKLLKTATVTDELPADMSLVASSVRPPAQVNGRTLTWRLSDVPAIGTVLSYQVRPQTPGRRPTNVQAAINYTDALDATTSAMFPVPEIDVLPRGVWSVFLPTLSNAECQPKRADIVLAIDTSSSMDEPAQPGGSALKIDEALQAARTFLDVMSLSDNRAAIVTFDTDSRVNQELTNSRGALEFALAAVQTSPGTRIDRGLETALREVLGPRHLQQNTPVIVLMTDGRPSGGSEGATASNAALAQQLGVTVYTIGLGADHDGLLLELVAGDPRRFYFAPDTDALHGVYRQIAGAALCQ